MTEEQIKAKAKEQFPNDEFDQQIVIDAINWATKELQEENKRLAKHILELQKDKGRLTDENRQAKEIINSFLDIVEFQAIDDAKTINKIIKKAEAFLKE